MWYGLKLMKSVTDIENLKKITLAAEMHYIYDMPQKDIAAKLGVSRPWVSQLLKKAKELGIVRIDINSPLTGCSDIEEGIKKRFPIENVYVIKCVNGEDYSNLNIAAANYLVSHIMPDDIIGVGWGMSIANMIDYVTEMRFEHVKIVPIIGGAGSESACLSSVCANRLSTVLGAQCQLLHANAHCCNIQEYEAVMSNDSVKSVIELGEQSDIALVGMGNIEDSRIVEYNYVNEEDRIALEKCGVVGDIAFRFIDKGGEIADVAFNKRIVACDLKKIRKNAREVIALAYGVNKVDTIKAALKGGWISTLFIDSETAELIICDN